jgi:hypothetical protein
MSKTKLKKLQKLEVHLLCFANYHFFLFSYISLIHALLILIALRRKRERSFCKLKASRFYSMLPLIYSLQDDIFFFTTILFL